MCSQGEAHPGVGAKVRYTMVEVLVQAPIEEREELWVRGKAHSATGARLATSQWRNKSNNHQLEARLEGILHIA